MSDDSPTLSACYAEAERHRKSLDTHLSSNDVTFQDNLSSAILKYQDCVRIAAAISLLSPNETLDDISSGDLKYLLLHHQIAELLLRCNRRARKEVLLSAREEVERFLRLLDQYDALWRGEVKMWERYKEGRDSFEVAGTADGGSGRGTGGDTAAAMRRESKIRRFREEKALKAKMEYLTQNPTLLTTSDETLRNLHLTQLSHASHTSFSTLESIGQELQILSLAPSPQSNGHRNGTNPPTSPSDARNRTRDVDGYSDRLDPSLSALSNMHTGPLLSTSGRPLRPFTLMDARSRAQDGVFRPGHSLPSMSIDEYLAEERRRGGIIDAGANGGTNGPSGAHDGGGGSGAGAAGRVDDDDLEASDRATMEARAWDKFKEDNPRGSGNTMNMG